MPLIKSGSKNAVSENIRELHTGKTFAHTAAKFGKEKADKQAVAIALNVARKATRAMGGTAPKISIPKPVAPFKPPTASPPFFVRNEARGLGFSRPNLSALKADGGATAGVGQMPFYVRNEAQSLAHTGPILSAVPGRTDNHAIDVPSSSYILPADHVSSLGQGNTLAGMKILSRMFPNSVQRSAPMGRGAMPPRTMSDRGGARGSGGGNVPIMAAGGEFSISPTDVAAVGGGDIDRGHRILDEWVKANRREHIRTLRKLPGPAKS
jgi:hypothetical protein